MKQQIKQWVLVASAMAMCVNLAAWAEGKTEAQTSADASPSPHQVVETVTSELMGVVANGKESIKSNPEKYFQDVRGIMEDAVDFKYIARNVMGAKYWKAATNEQKSRFIEAFTSGMVETYAKGMANFADFEISVLPPEDGDIGEKRKVEVIQKFKGPEGISRVSYTMGKHRNGQWKLLNVVLDGVNLGKTLRAQFSQSMNESKGDLNSAIEGWNWEA
ncbi:MAG: ABC transporter substrate-binding protein [Agarilytica sp.]